MLKINNYVKKLLKKKSKIINIDEIKNIFKSIDEQITNKQIYKQIYYLKNRWFLISIKKDLFFIKNTDDTIDVDDVIESYYWKILKKHLQQKYWQNYFISWIKALEIWNNNFSIPNNLIIVNPYKRSFEILLKERKLQNVNYCLKWLDIDKSFKFFKKQTTKTYIDNKLFNIANYELSVIDSLYSLAGEDEKYTIELIKKNIRKNHKKINIKIFEYFLKYWKYGSSIKKLYEISLWIRPDFADKIHKILKRWYWL